MTATSRFLRSGDVRAVRDDASAARTAAVQAEAAHQDAVAAAYAAGLDDGRDQAVAAGSDALPRVALALEQLLALSRSQNHVQVDETSGAVLAAAVDIAEWLLRGELDASSHSLLARLQEASTSLLPSNRARVRVSPSDAPAVQEWADRHGGLDVLVDAALPAGDAHWDSGTGSVDVTVATALRTAAAALGVE